MPRHPRHDRVGSLHHVVNRGQGGMTIYHRAEDHHFFRDLLELGVQGGRIRVHAYCTLDNHFHLLVESMVAELGEAMRWMLGRYAAYHNSVHGHAGHVFQRRYWSGLITDTRYLRAAIRYIDLNALRAGKPGPALHYEHGSAVDHVSSSEHPAWLSRIVIDRFLRRYLEAGDDRETAYGKAFRIGNPKDRSARLIEERLKRTSGVPDDLAVLAGADDETWLRWFLDRTRQLPRARKPLPIADADSVLQALAARLAEGHTPAIGLPSARLADTPQVAAAGLLRDLSSMSNEEIRLVQEVSISKARRLVRQHRDLVRTEPPYLDLLVQVARRALEACLGPEIEDFGVL